MNESAEKENKAVMVSSAELSQYLPQRTEENNTRTVKRAGTAAKIFNWHCPKYKTQLQNTVSGMLCGVVSNKFVKQHNLPVRVTVMRTSALTRYDCSPQQSKVHKSISNHNEHHHWQNSPFLPIAFLRRFYESYI